MKGFTIIYDKLLFAYCYIDVWVNQTLDYIGDFWANAHWIKENGVYKGKDHVESDDKLSR